MLEILTPLNKVERVSRKIDPSTFVAAPGIWAAVNSTGGLVNVTTDTPAKVNKLVISSASSNVYESQDVEVGRITSLESYGVRVKVDSAGYNGTISQGDLLVVSTGAATKGKLVSVAETAETGDYEQVARAEEVNTSAGWIIFRTMSPVMVTLT